MNERDLRHIDNLIKLISNQDIKFKGSMAEASSLGLSFAWLQGLKEKAIADIKETKDKE